MKLKLFCPYCGRCLGECLFSDETGDCQVLTKRPLKIKKESFVHDMKCVRCKNEIFILMELKNN